MPAPPLSATCAMCESPGACRKSSLGQGARTGLDSDLDMGINMGSSFGVDPIMNFVKNWFVHIYGFRLCDEHGTDFPGVQAAVFTTCQGERDGACFGALSADNVVAFIYSCTNAKVSQNRITGAHCRTSAVRTPAQPLSAARARESGSVSLRHMLSL